MLLLAEAVEVLERKIFSHLIRLMILIAAREALIVEGVIPREDEVTEGDERKMRWPLTPLKIIIAAEEALTAEGAI